MRPHKKDSGIVICDECGRESRPGWEAVRSARIVNFYVCDECLAKEEENEEEELDYFCKHGYPKLTGSKKQIKWGYDIRAKMITKISKGKMKAFTHEMIKEQTDSVWFIDNRRKR